MRDEATFEGDDPVATSVEVLRDRRELALVALERTRMPIVITDAQHRDMPIVLANQAFLDLTGYSAEEVIGRNCRFLQGPGTAASDVDAIRSRLARNEGLELELLNYRKDGTTFWNQLAISPISDDAGKLLYHFASQKDVSARRRAQDAEEAERLLLMEIDHRAMNALSLVQSFVRMSRTDSVEAYARAVQQRVDALARAHRLLAENGWGSIELGDVIAMETPAEAFDHTRADGPLLRISSQIVQPLTLALHELMANALSHGALSQPDGSVAISWCHVDGADATIRWREEGPRLRTEPACDGLGLKLVRGVVQRQLRGRMTFDWTEYGLDATLSFPPAGPARPGGDDDISAFRARTGQQPSSIAQ